STNIQTITLAYIIMESLPGNPIPIVGNLQGAKQTMKIIEYGLQLLKAIYDMHQIGLIHRDIKPENVGMYDNKLVVMYDMGMARVFLDDEGHHRPPRSHAGMRGTEEWSSLNAEIGRDQGRVDDLWGWLYCLNEWVNCRSQKPQVWSAYEREPNVRQLMKSTFFPTRMVLNNCPFVFYRISWYLRTLGRDDTPDYFYLATILQES
ncbi:hypothetical protein Angca_008774, partial [Angiostrongylus cantonensis]